MSLCFFFSFMKCACNFNSSAVSWGVIVRAQSNRVTHFVFCSVDIINILFVSLLQGCGAQDQTLVSFKTCLVILQHTVV